MEASSINRIPTIDLKHRSILKQQFMNMDGHVTHESEDDERMQGGVIEDDKSKSTAVGGGASSKKGSVGGGGGSSMKMCQAEKCSVDLSDSKPYHRRHKVCEHHAKAQVALVAGIRQRFCQQCSSADFTSCWNSMNRKEVAEGVWQATTKGGVKTSPNSNGQTIYNKGSAPAARSSLSSVMHPQHHY